MKSVPTNHWLRHSSATYFHAYLSPRSGTPALCRRAPPIPNLMEMDIPGDRSRLCNGCFDALYGTRFSTLLKRDKA